MISETVAKQQVARFNGTRDYPRTKEALRSLVNAFIHHAESEHHAATIADELLVETVFCPRPAEVLRVALATRAEREPSNCPKCNGTGFEYVEIKGVEHAQKCECRP